MGFERKFNLLIMFIEIENCCIDISNIAYFKKYINRLGQQFCMIYFKQQSNYEVCLEDSDSKIYNQLYKFLSVSPLFSSVENDNTDDGKVKW